MSTIIRKANPTFRFSTACTKNIRKARPVSIRSMTDSIDAWGAPEGAADVHKGTGLAASAVLNP